MSTETPSDAARDSAESTLARLTADLFLLRETRPGSHLYLLLDSDCPVPQDHPLHPARLAERAVPPTTVPLFPERGGTGADDRSPVLLRFYRSGENGYQDEELIDLSLSTATAQCRSVNGSHVAAWIASNLEPDALAASLAARCRLFDSFQARERFMPLYQPHRMATLLDDPDGARFLDHFLSPTQFWAFVDASGSLRVATQRQPAVTAQASRPVRLSLDQCRRQSRVPLMRLVLLGLTKAGHEIPAKAERQIGDQLSLAASIGFTHDEDTVFFALNGLTLSPRWHEHPAARQCIESSVRDGASLPGAMGELSDSALDDISRFRADD